MENIEAIESYREAEQQRLDGLRTPEERNRWGQFATSSGLALDIVRYAWSLWDGHRDPVEFLDPAIGSGAFYGALRQVFPAMGVGRAVGVEIDTVVASSAVSLWSRAGLTVLNADFTELAAPSQPFNLILTNPPYVRHHHISREKKEELKATLARELGIRISGLAGLYCYFLLLCDRWLAEGGLAAWLIPSEFMSVNYGDAVKRYLTERVTLKRIHRFSPLDVQFGDALVTSAVVVFEKGAPSPTTRVEMSFGGSLLEPNMTESITVEALSAARKWTAYPGLTSETKVDRVTLGDLFAIKRGIATGANSFFILPREEALSRGIPNEYMKPILPSVRLLREEVIESAGDGYPELAEPLSLIDCDLPEEEIRLLLPRFWEYLMGGKEQGLHEGYLASRRSPWYSQEKRPPAPFLCTYMGRQRAGGNPFRFFWNKSQATAPNVYLLLYPRPALAAVLKMRPQLYAMIFAWLREIETDRLIGGGRVYGGGLHKLEPNELAALPAQALAETAGLSLPLQLEFAW